MCETVGAGTGAPAGGRCAKRRETAAERGTRQANSLVEATKLTAVTGRCRRHSEKDLGAAT